MASSTSSTNRLIVAAMDFGTTYSGYAFSFRNDPMEISTNQCWVAGSQGLASLKTPTSLLLNSNQEFCAFGYEAENQFCELALDDEHHDWYYFKQFKMLLHNNTNLKRDTTIKDTMGKSVPAIKVFSLSIAYLKRHVLKTLQDQASGVEHGDVHFVITVPAIWEDSSKQFMREAAIEAGIDSEHLSIALEPEAASVFCQNLPTEKMQQTSGCQLTVTKAGTKYMVIDIGGGTADITVHEKRVDGSLKELHIASGGPWGGTAVDRAFMQLLSDILGPRILDIFAKEHMANMIDLVREFETKKRTISMTTDRKVTLTVPGSLKEVFEENTKLKIEAALDQSKYAGRITWKRDKLRMEADIAKDLFQTTVNSILTHVEGILRDDNMSDVNMVLLVGGFSECEMIQQAFRQKFHDKTIIIPKDAGLVVLKGAVVFGHKPHAISARICKYTYGAKMVPKFDPAKHPKSKSIQLDGEKFCDDVFRIFVQAGDEIILGHTVSRITLPADKNQEFIDRAIYVSTDKSPSFVTDPSCRLIGRMQISLPPYEETNRRIEETVTFGDTELHIQARDLATRSLTESYCDFL